MSLKILCSVYLFRHPVGGHTWHHLQYLIGLRRMGHDVVCFEHYGWPNSCFDAGLDEMTADPAYGITYMRELLADNGLADRWCYLAEDGQAHGMSREALAAVCADSDLYLNLSNMNWLPELELCRRRALVDTDPVFTQIGGHGAGPPFDWYHTLFTYGENVHRSRCEMPAGGARWVATRQPVVLDLWPVRHGDPAAPCTSIFNWSAYGDRTYEGRVYGQKDREFEPFISFPRQTQQPMALALNAPEEVRHRLLAGGWRLVDPLRVAKTPFTYQEFLRASKAEFCVAKHAYVSTHCGWFSDRTAGYLASGRPAVVQDTGFSRSLPVGEGLVAFATPGEAAAGLKEINNDYAAHCKAARRIAESFFDSSKVLTDLLSRCF